MSFKFLFFIILLPFLTCAYDVTFDSAVNLNWVNCYDLATCSLWRQCPSGTAEATCVKFKAVANATYTNADGLAIGRGTVTDAFLRLTMVQQESYVFSQGSTDEAPSTQFPPTPNVRTSSCLSALDVAIDPSCPTATFFRTNQFSDLPSSHYCLMAFQGYGSVYNTICEPYASQLSNIYTTSQPTGNVFTDFGSERVRRTTECYYENWAKYRSEPYKADISYLEGCDVVYYFTNTLQDRAGNIAFIEREEGDWDTMRAIRDRYPTMELVLTFGGWTSNNTIMYAAMTTHRSTLVPQILSLSDDIGFGIDFDVEFPGASNGLADVFPLDIDTIVSFMTEICTHVHRNNRRCFWGGLGVGSHYIPDLISRLYSEANVDQFNMFGYDLHGPWEGVMEHQNALYTAKGPFPNFTLIATVENFVKIVPIKYLSIGFPFYGRGAVVDRTGKVIGNFPLESPMLGPGEFGSDIIHIRNGVEMPAIYNPNTDNIIQDPEGFFILQRPLTTGTGVLYYSNSTTFEIIFKKLTDLGVTHHFIYASSMAKGSAARINDIVKRQSNRRARRSLITYYAYPRSAGSSSGAVNCPGVISYTDHIVVTTVGYAGCLKTTSTSSLCFFSTHNFTCSPSTDYQLLPQTESACSGINTNTLLPSIPTDVSVVCDNLHLKVQQVSICPPPPENTVSTFTEISVPATFGSWTLTTIPVHTTFQTHTEVLQLPFTCTNITRLPPCAELLCGTDTNCHDIIQQPPYTSVCQSLGFSIQSYHQAVDSYLAEHKAMTDAFLHLTKTASINFPSVRGNTRSKRSPGALGLGFGFFGTILGAVSLGVSVSNTADISKLSTEFNNFRQTSNANFEQVQQKFNEFRDKTTAILRDQAEINQAFQGRLDEVARVVESNFEGVKAKFTEIDAAINAIVNSINSLSDTVTKNAAVSASTDTTIARVQAASTLISSSRFAVTTTTSQLRLCAASLSEGRLTGCVSGGVDAIPLQVKPFSNGNTQGIVFLYASRKTVGSVSIRATTSFCNDSTLFIAAPNCMFTLNGTTVSHVDRALETCHGSIAQPVKDCPSTIVTLNHPTSTVALDFTPVFTASPTPSLNVSLTNFTIEGLSEFIGYNHTSFLALVEELEQIKLDLQPIPGAPGWTTSTIIAYVGISLSILGILVSFISTMYSCSISKAVGYFTKNR